MAGKTSNLGKGKEAKPAKRHVPFKKAGAGIEAHGHVSELREHHDGSGVRMSVKHGKKKPGGDGICTSTWASA